MIVWYTSRRASQQGRSVGPHPDRRSAGRSGRERVGRSGRPELARQVGGRARWSSQPSARGGLWSRAAAGSGTVLWQGPRATWRAANRAGRPCDRTARIARPGATRSAILWGAPSRAPPLEVPAPPGRRSVGRRDPTSPTRPQPPGRSVFYLSVSGRPGASKAEGGGEKTKTRKQRGARGPFD